MNCNTLYRRADLQQAFRDNNPDWNFSSNEIAPDGDVLLSDEQVKKFKVSIDKSFNFFL
jgi:hypothetical protein